MLRLDGDASGRRRPSTAPPPEPMPTPPAIEDYALIGNCRTAALVARNGAIEWLCWPRFDSSAVFGALLDRARGGTFAVRPAVPFSVTRRYLPDTNVLETTFHTARGRARVTDLMPVFTEADERRRFIPSASVLRRVQGIAGEVPLEIEYAPRYDYGRVPPRLHRRGALGIFCAHRGAALLLQGSAAFTIEGAGAWARLTLRAGESHDFLLSYADREPLAPPALADASELLDRTVGFWRTWCAHCNYAGPYRAAVMRSLLVLKLLAYAPSGAIVAAPTTSLPEQPGGIRNWDYRYCWLRDASMTLRALFSLGYIEEGERFLGWMLHSTRLTWPELKVLYDVYGETRLKERALPFLHGYGGARPVRIGNDAKDQLQLDVYGEVLDAVFEYVCHGRRTLDRATSRMLIGFGETVCRRWREPDDGIWETRGGRRHHTFSKVLCWVALDRLIRLHDAGAVKLSRARFAAERVAIARAIEAEGYSERLGSYVTAFGDEAVDGSLLLLPYYGYGPRERMRRTYYYLRDRLGAGELFYRYRPDYDDGLPPGEGTFAACAFWAVECRALHGEVDAARADFERLLARANDVGLYGEEIDAASGAAFGNFPQAYTHVGLINAALRLAGRRRPAESGA